MLTPEQKRMNKGTAACPLSGALFDFEQSVQTGSVKKDKFGNIVKEWKVTGEEE
jgi:hypothetical protein